MNKLEMQRKNNKILYRELFFEADKTFKDQLIKLRENISCSNCSSECKISNSGTIPFVTAVFQKNCSFRKWQEICIDKIKNEIKHDIQQKITDIMDYRENFECSRCGTCCKLGCSESSYEELRQKAKNGDEFAKQFTSVFIPYKNMGEAKKVFSEYVELVEQTLDEDEKIHFYHCPHLTEKNFCTNYDQRPEICRDFPDNPLSILPDICGFHEWKEEVIVAAMMLHAMTYIYEFYLEKIEQAYA